MSNCGAILTAPSDLIPPSLHISVEGIKRALYPGVFEELQIGSRAAVAVAHHDVFGDRLESRAEMLARFDYDVALCARVDAAMSEDANVVGFAALFRY